MPDPEGPLVEAAKRYLKEQYGEDTISMAVTANSVEQGKAAWRWTAPCGSAARRPIGARSSPSRAASSRRCLHGCGEMERLRARDVGLVNDGLPTGRHNAITDVPGVRVGHATLWKGDGPLRPGEGPVRTGVTVVQPHGGNLFREKVRAAVHTINGFARPAVSRRFASSA